MMMKYAAILSFVIGALIMPLQAQAQQAGAPAGFNGHVWDAPPVQNYQGPAMMKPKASQVRKHRARSAS
jgi:hypothetical protein